MDTRIEYDFPPGHPGRADYTPGSLDATDWARHHVHPLGQRDFPVDHPKAADTPGNENAVVWTAGVDPRNPHREAFTGRTPEQAAAVKRLSLEASRRALESPVMQPLDAITAAAAMNAKRKELGRDILTPAEHAAVLAELQQQPRAAQPSAEEQAAAARYREALAYLTGKGVPAEMAAATVRSLGAETVLTRGHEPPEGA